MYIANSIKARDKLGTLVAQVRLRREDGRWSGRFCLGGLRGRHDIDVVGDAVRDCQCEVLWWPLALCAANARLAPKMTGAQRRPPKGFIC